MVMAEIKELERDPVLLGANECEEIIVVES
jgi:hypothetical protein